MNVKTADNEAILPPNSDFASKLQWLMLRDGVSHKTLSRAIGRSERQVFRYCNRENVPTRTVLKSIAEYFMVDITWLKKNERVKRSSEDEEMHSTSYNYLRTIQMPNGISNAFKADAEKIVKEKFDISRGTKHSVSVDVVSLSKRRIGLRAWAKNQCSDKEFEETVRRINETADYLLELLGELKINRRADAI